MGTARSIGERHRPARERFVDDVEEATFLAPLPVRDLWGVGPRAEDALTKADIRTIGQLASADPLRT